MSLEPLSEGFEKALTQELQDIKCSIAKMYTADEVREIAMNVVTDAVNGDFINPDKYLTK